MNTLRKTLTAAVAALAVASGALATVGSAEAGQRYGRHHSYHGGGSAAVTTSDRGASFRSRRSMTTGAIMLASGRCAFATNLLSLSE
jgi:hypothetical protein